MLRYISATITCAAAGEYECQPLSGAGPGKKKVKEVWIACKTATDTMVDDFRVYLDTERLVDIPKEMIWGIAAATIDLPRRIVIPLNVEVDVNELLKVAILSDAGTHNYHATVVYET